jgi:hypothetical protein
MSLPSSRDPKELIFSFYHGHWFCVYPGTKKSCSDTTTSTYQHNSIVISALPKLLKPFDILAFNVLSILLTVLSPPDSTKYLRMNLITACKIHITRFNCQRAILFELWHQKHVQDKRYKHIELWGKKKNSTHRKEVLQVQLRLWVSSYQTILKCRHVTKWNPYSSRRLPIDHIMIIPAYMACLQCFMPILLRTIKRA